MRTHLERAAALSTTRPLPDDFAVRALRDNVKSVLEHYGCAWTTFNRWCVEAGIADQIEQRRERRRTYGQLPGDFAQRAPLESSRALGRHYGVNKDTIAAWRKLTGIVAPFSIRRQEAAARKVERQQARPAVKVARKPGVPWNRDMRGPPPQKDDSPAGRAQQFLQRRMPVYKASILDKKRTGYIVDGRPMTPEAMIAFAEAKGFDAREWATL